MCFYTKKHSVVSKVSDVPIVVLLLFDSSITEGDDRVQVDQLTVALREEWSKMSQEEKVKATEDALEDLKSRNKDKELAVHNLAITSFHDARANLDSVEKTVRDLQHHDYLTIDITYEISWPILSKSTSGYCVQCAVRCS